MGFKTFEDLEVYKKAREFRKKIYKLIKELPREEKFNLVGQMRRAALKGMEGIIIKKISNSADNQGVLYVSCRMI